MRTIYRRTGLCLLTVVGMTNAGQESWEELMRRSERLLEQGKFGEAEAVLLSAVKAAEVFGPADRRLAETQHFVGRAYAEFGRLPEAEKWFERSLSSWQSGFGKHDRKAPKPLISLASLYLENGLDRKAERLVDSWLRRPEFKLDLADPSSVRLLNNIAGIKYAQRKYSESETLYRQVLSAAETTLGSKSLQVSVLNNLGLLLARTGRGKEAGHYMERALAAQEGAQPPNDIDLARVLSNVAAFYRSTRAYAKAEPLFERALALAESNLGPEHRLVGQILAEYALLLRETKRKGEARALENRAKAIRQDHAAQDLGRHTVDFRDLTRRLLRPAPAAHSLR